MIHCSKALDQVKAAHNEIVTMTAIVSTATMIKAIIALAVIGKSEEGITVLDMSTSVATVTLQVVTTEIVVVLHRDHIPGGDPPGAHDEEARSKEARNMRLREIGRGDDDGRKNVDE